MRKYLIFYAVATTLALALALPHYRTENQRLRRNQTALLQKCDTLRLRNGRSAATVQALRLRYGEMRELRAADAERVRRMGIRLRELQQSAVSVTATNMHVQTLLHDTIIRRDTATGVARCDTLRWFRWQDTWTQVTGQIDGRQIRCEVYSVDTLQQVVYRVPRRFLWFRFGTKALRQTVTSTNPHTRIVCTEYIECVRQ